MEAAWAVRVRESDVWAVRAMEACGGNAADALTLSDRLTRRELALAWALHMASTDGAMDDK